jgi:hypothetical protein
MAEPASVCASGNAARSLLVAWPAVWRQLPALPGLATPTLLLLLAGVCCRARMTTAAACCIHGTSLPQMAEPASVCASGSASHSLLAAWPAVWRQLPALPGLAMPALLLLLAAAVCCGRLTTAPQEMAEAPCARFCAFSAGVLPAEQLAMCQV